MKKITKLLLLALALMLALALLASCGGNGEGDGEGNGEGDGESEGSGDGSTEGGGDQGGENTAISKKAWEAAFDFDNATMNVVESVYYATTLYQSESYNTYFANGEGYDKYGLSQGSVAENVFYFAFKESFDSFKHNPTTDEYTCASITIDEFLYEDVVVKFTVDGKLSSICFSYLYYYYYTMKTTVTFTDHEVTVRPEKKEYCSLLDTRDIEGHDLAYITIKVKDYGDIKLVLDATTAPITVKHILKLISEGFYDGLTFHRVIEKFMIQGGDPDANGTGGYKDQDGDKITIKGEFSANGIENDIQHLRGVISMARGSGYNTASSQFFICNADSTHLDENYAAFGYVIDGLSIVDQITEDTKSYGDSNGGIADKDKQVIIESIVVDELVGIKLDGTEGDTEYTGITKADWKAAFEFNNVTMIATERYYSNGVVAEEYVSNVYFVDGVAYDSDGIDRGEISAYRPYFAFVDNFYEFEFDPATSKYTSNKVVVGNIEFFDIVVVFAEDGRLSLIEFTANSGGYEFRVIVSFSDYGNTKIPERDPFVAEGDEYCSYLNTRDLEGRELAYITIKVKNYGDIKLVLDATTAPITVKHILKLISEGFYDGLTFHRVIDGFMIQGGDPEANGTGDYKDNNGDKVTIKGEFSSNGYDNDIKHIRGVISMARGNDKDSASCQFFICNADASASLDGKYAAFGYVIDGMSVVDHITYDTKIFGDDNGSIANKDKQAVIESITIDELVGIELGE